MNIAIFLVGGEPFPNMISLGYMESCDRDDFDEIPVPDKVFMVFSNYTEQIKDRLVRFVKNAEVVEVPLGDKGRSFTESRDLFLSLLREENDRSPITSISLNYTGGTKAMALAVYRGIIDFCDGQNIPEVVFSYLSPNSDKLEVNDRCDLPKGDKGLSNFIDMDLGDFLALKGLGDAPSYKMDLPECYTELKAIGADVFRDISSKDFQRGLDSVDDELRKIFDCDDLNKVLRKIDKDQGSQGDVADIFEKYIFSLVPGLKKLVLQEHCNWKSLYELVSYEWLELLIFDVLSTEFKELKSYRDIYIEQPGKVPFQIDVFAIKNYKSFLFSCTTDSKEGLCKQKAFEANQRSRQIGGGHAKTILVSLSSEDQCSKIKNNMSDFGINFSILGIDTVLDRDKLVGAISEILK
nr:hypothetical protein [uncultured Dethiosulfovibrio sp.]